MSFSEHRESVVIKRIAWPRSGIQIGFHDYSFAQDLLFTTAH